MNDLVELGRIVGAHGVRGELRADNWLEPALWEGLETLLVNGVEYPLRGARPHKGFMLLTLGGVEDMDGALALRGRALTVPRSALRLREGQFLYRDLYGFTVFDLRSDGPIGTLKEVRESPASLLYVVEIEGREALIPAVPAFDRGVDFETRTLRVETIEGMLE